MMERYEYKFTITLTAGGYVESANRQTGWYSDEFEHLDAPRRIPAGACASFGTYGGQHCYGAQLITRD